MLIRSSLIITLYNLDCMTLKKLKYGNTLASVYLKIEENEGLETDYADKQTIFERK